MAETLTAERRREYQDMFDTLTIRTARQAATEAIVDKIVAKRTRYESVGDPMNIPWFFIGIIHSLEGELNFGTHLHNGDPLTARTKNVPKDRPKTGQPPFTWEVSAADALRLKDLQSVKDWSVPAMLFQFERYNGFGYRSRKIFTPYLWSFSQHYTKGKFVKDNEFSATAVSQQCGDAVLSRRMAERAIVTFDVKNKPVDIATIAPLVKYAPKTFSEDAERLQEALNQFPGIFVKVDGLAGKRTSDALKRVTGHFLAGDPRGVS